MLAKCAIAAVLALSALLAAEVRADEPSPLPGVRVTIMDWIRKEYPRDVERVLKYLATPAFQGLFAELNEKCGLHIDVIELSSSTSVSSDRRQLRLEVDNRDLKRLLESRPGQCEKIFKSRDELQATLGEKVRVQVDPDLIVRADISAKRVAAWAGAALKVSLSDVFARHGEACRRPIERLELTNLNSYLERSKTYELATSDNPIAHLKALERATRACAQNLPELAELNSTLGLEHGLVFYVDPRHYFEGEVSPAGVKAWLSYFRKDPRRLDALKKAILKSKPDEYEEIRKCAGSTAPECRRRLIGVSFSNYTGFSRFDWAAGLFMLMGDLVSAGVMAIDSAIDGPSPNLKANDSPRIPSKLD